MKLNLLKNILKPLFLCPFGVALPRLFVFCVILRVAIPIFALPPSCPRCAFSVPVLSCLC